MYLIYGLPNMAGQFIFTGPRLMQKTDTSEWAFTLTLESPSRSEEAAAIDAAARLQRMSIEWLRPLTKPTGPWKVDLAALAEYFYFQDRAWLIGERLIRPIFEHKQDKDRNAFLLNFVFAPAGPLAWEYGETLEPTKWAVVDRLIARIQSVLETAIASEELQQVGLLSRDLTIALADAACADHSSSVSTSDSKRRLQAYFERVLLEERREYIALAKAVYDFAVHLQHKRTATYTDALLRGRVAITFAEVVRIIAEREQEETPQS